MLTRRAGCFWASTGLARRIHTAFKRENREQIQAESGSKAASGCRATAKIKCIPSPPHDLQFCATVAELTLSLETACAELRGKTCRTVVRRSAKTQNR
jgi:hypothetical protein